MAPDIAPVAVSAPCEPVVMAPVDEWKPCEVLQAERWCPGYVERWRRDERG